MNDEILYKVHAFINDLWQFMKPTWQPEDIEAYWTDLIDRADALIDKYSDLPIAKKFVVAYLEHQDSAWKEIERGKNG